MIRTLIVNTVLLSTALWMTSLSASARTDAFVPAVNRAHAPILWAGAIYTGGDNGGNGNGYDNGGNWDKDKGKGDHDGWDGDKDKGKHDRDGHAPTPEPSTVLSFGAALLIGGGVLYSRRLRKSRK